MSWHLIVGHENTNIVLVCSSRSSHFSNPIGGSPVGKQPPSIISKGLALTVGQCHQSGTALVRTHPSIGLFRVSRQQYLLHQIDLLRLRFRLRQSRRFHLNTSRGHCRIPSRYLRAGSTVFVGLCLGWFHRVSLPSTRGLSCSALQLPASNLLWPRLTSAVPSRLLPNPVANGRTADLPG